MKKQHIFPSAASVAALVFLIVAFSQCKSKQAITQSFESYKNQSRHTIDSANLVIANAQNKIQQDSILINRYSKGVDKMQSITANFDKEMQAIFATFSK